jgi:hypothetical protein
MYSENTLTQIYEALDFDQDDSECKAYGLTEINGELIAKMITTSQDVYLMIESINDDRLVDNTNYDFISIITHGWAAPLDSNGEVSGPPSQHPNKRRVRLLISLDVKNREMIGSTIKFADDEDALNDAILGLVRN